jgi:hypothetical protein
LYLKLSSVLNTAFNASDADEYSFVFNTVSQPYKFFRDGNSFFAFANAPVYFPDGAVVKNITA